jgi:RHS repeat-associated protein
LTAVNGAVVWSATYDSFGNAQINTEAITNNLRSPGQYFNAETGLHYNLNRYYDPIIGRYLRTDPQGDGLNLYAYVFSNPVNLIDPLGLCAVNASKRGIKNVWNWWSLKIVRGTDSTIDFLFPVPFSTKRSFQPVDELVKKISNITKIPILPKKTIEKIKETKPLKDILEKEAKKEIEGAFRINNKKSFQDKNILVIDDIFGTGSTVTELTKIISPFFNTISILTMTKTRTNGGLKPSNNLPF